MANWKLKTNNINLACMCDTLGIDIKIANVLANRNINTKNTAIKFLNPDLKFMHDIFKMKNIYITLELIRDAIKTQKKIIIYGDYDVDGVMSTVILHKALSLLGANINYALPSRFEDGFGLNKNLIKKFYDSGYQVILTCDNGIAAHEEIKQAKNLNMQVIIIDHHEPNTHDGKDILPCADAILDNKQKDCEYDFKLLCAAGMCYKLAEILLKDYLKKDLVLNDLLVFAGIATMCDVVALQDENRIIAKNSIRLINKKKFFNLGLKELLKINKICGREINSIDIGFIIGPCINACGRLKNANLAVELFLSQDQDQACELAQEIFNLNEERKNLTRLACEEVFSNLCDYDFKNKPVMIFYNKNISESIAGIIAGKIKEKFFHPVLFFTDGKDFIKGSGRSIENYNMFEELQACSDLFIKFGGHPMAAGVSMHEKNFDLLCKRLNQNCCLKPQDFICELNIDSELDFTQIDYNFAREILSLEPFGHLNHEPLFMSRNIHVRHVRIIPEKDTLIFDLCDNKKNLKAICFGMLDYFKMLLNNQDSQKILLGLDANLYLDIVYAIEINNFNGRSNVQLRLKDFKISQK